MLYTVLEVAAVCHISFGHLNYLRGLGAIPHGSNLVDGERFGSLRPRIVYDDTEIQVIIKFFGQPKRRRKAGRLVAEAPDLNRQIRKIHFMVDHIRHRKGMTKWCWECRRAIKPYQLDAESLLKDGFAVRLRVGKRKSRLYRHRLNAFLKAHR